MRKKKEVFEKAHSGVQQSVRRRKCLFSSIWFHLELSEFFCVVADQIVIVVVVGGVFKFVVFDQCVQIYYF